MRPTQAEPMPAEKPRPRKRFKTFLKLYLVGCAAIFVVGWLSHLLPRDLQKHIEPAIVAGFLLASIGGWVLYYLWKVQQTQEAEDRIARLAMEFQDEQNNPYTKDGGPISGSVIEGYKWKTSETKNVSSSSFMGCGLAILPCIWLIWVFFYAPRHEASVQIIPKDCEVQLEINLSYPRSWPRLEVMQAKNLDIYMPLHEFQEVPFPDRKAAIVRIGRAWGKFTEWYWFSSVRFRDIETGKILAEYSCNFESVSLVSD